ncbi:MAG TPA: hypothetical protein VN181_02455, partial [Thermoanaerobaculia bacterium]|nr:hypothetical protein [Thermoanaerobaculia bacterium]
PWIELIIDNILAPPRALWQRLPIETERRLGEALYHEISHHIDAGRRRSGDLEERAEKWAKDMLRAYFRTKYWYIAPIARFVLRLWRRT